MSAVRRLQLVGTTAPAPLLFSQNSGLTQAEREYLSQLLAYHPHGQAVADELVGQLRARGRGAQGVRNPRGLAARLARVAMEQGVGNWYFYKDEATLRAQQVQQRQAQSAPPSASSALVRARALVELQKIKARHAAAQLVQGGQK